MSHPAAATWPTSVLVPQDVAVARETKSTFREVKGAECATSTLFACAPHTIDLSVPHNGMHRWNALRLMHGSLNISALTLVAPRHQMLQSGLEALAQVREGCLDPSVAVRHCLLGE